MIALSAMSQGPSVSAFWFAAINMENILLTLISVQKNQLSGVVQVVNLVQKQCRHSKTFLPDMHGRNDSEKQENKREKV